MDMWQAPTSPWQVYYEPTLYLTISMESERVCAEQSLLWHDISKSLSFSSAVLWQCECLARQNVWAMLDTSCCWKDVKT